MATVNTQALASLSQEQVKALLAEQFKNIGEIKQDGTVRVNGGDNGDTVPSYSSGGTAQPKLQPTADGNYRLDLTTPFDPSSPNGKYGYYAGTFKPDGTVVSVDFVPQQRDAGWIANHGPELTGAAFAIMAGMAAGPLISGTGPVTAAPEALQTAYSGATPGMLTSTAPATAAAPIVQGAGVSSIGPGATAGDIASYLAGGGSVSQAMPAIVNAAKTSGLGTVVNAIKTAVGPAGAGIIDSISNALGGSSGMLSNLATLGAGYTEATGLKNASNTAADSYENLGKTVAGGYNAVGDRTAAGYDTLAGNIDARTQGIGTAFENKYSKLGTEGQGMLSSLGNNAQTAYGNLGTAVGNTYNGLADQYKAGYNALADKTAASVGKFTPYNITTNVGSTDQAGKFTPTAGVQGISDSATQAAQSSFGAANAIDVNNLAKQRYDLMQGIFASGDSASLAEIRANEQAKGRGGIQSMNPAYASGGTGSNPAMVAYYKALEDRNLKAQLNAADQALAQRGGLLSQGVSASGVPLSIGTQGLQQVQTGVQAGSTAFQNTLAGTKLPADIAQRGLDQGLFTATRGADQVTGLFDKGLTSNVNAQRAGIDTFLTGANKGADTNLAQLNLGTEAAGRFGASGVAAQNSAGLQGLDAQTRLQISAIGQRYQGNLAATNVIASLLRSIAAQKGVATPATNGTAEDMLGALVKLGISPSQANQIIANQAQQMGPPDISQDYSIWETAI